MIDIVTARGLQIIGTLDRLGGERKPCWLSQNTLKPTEPPNKAYFSLGGK